MRFPSTIEEMKDIVDTESAAFRSEFHIVPEGLSITQTDISTYWYYREGNRIATLHFRGQDNHECFTVEGE